MSSQSYLFNPTERTLAAAGDGFSAPRLTTTDRLALTLGVNGKGMMVYDTTLTTLCLWNGTAWEFIGDNSNGWVSVKDFGAKGDGVTNDTAAFQAAMQPNSSIYVPAGTYMISASLVVPDNFMLFCAKGSTLKALSAGITFFTSTVSAYFSQIWNASLDGNGFANVTGFDLTNFRISAGLYSPFMTNMLNGIILRTGCFGLTVLNPSTFNGVPNPIRVISNGSNISIINPNLDNLSGVGANTGTGIKIDASGGSNIGVIVDGGYIQGFQYGINDEGLSTKVTNTYFEGCTSFDVYSVGATCFLYTGTVHFGTVGAVAFKASNCDGGTVYDPTMASGARTTGVFDFDGTNTNCFYYFPPSASSRNSPLGTVTGLGILPAQTFGTFTPVLVGSGTAGVGTYTQQLGKWSKTGNVVHFNLGLAWTAHTGTGNMIVTGLPAGLVPANFNPQRLFNLRVTGFAFTGPVIYSGFSGVSTNQTLYQVSAVGVASLTAMAAAGTINIEGSYEV